MELLHFKWMQKAMYDTTLLPCKVIVTAERSNPNSKTLSHLIIAGT